MATRTTKAPEATTPTEPDFAALTTSLAEADANARSTSADAGAARAERSAVAVSAIRAAFNEHIQRDLARKALLDAGALKGTVSKIITVLDALNNKEITLHDVKSLNAAYSLVKAAHAAGVYTSPSAYGTPYAAPVVPVNATTPDEAMQLIIDVVKSIKDPDEAYRVAGEWITKITNGITSALSASAEDEEGEEGEED